MVKSCELRKNRIKNGYFSHVSSVHDHFPQDWLRVGGNYKSTWKYKIKL